MNKFEKRVAEVTKAITQLELDFPDVQFGIFITKQDLINLTAQFLNEPATLEIYKKIEARLNVNSSKNIKRIKN